MPPRSQLLSLPGLRSGIAASRSTRSRLGCEEFSIEPGLSLDSVREAWIRLDESADNLFTTWTWTALWWEHFGRRAALRCAVVGDNRRDVVAILPLYIAKRFPFRVLRFLGHGVSDQLGPVCRSEDQDLAARALGQYLSRSRGWELFVADDLPDTQNWEAMLGGRLVHTVASPLLRPDGMGWDDYLRTRSRSFRHSLQRKARRLADKYRDVTYRMTTERGSLDDDLETLFRLHAARWGPDSPFAARRRAFHREFAQYAFDQGWLRLWLLEIDQQPVAATQSFRFGNEELGYQSGRDPAWDADSVGWLLKAHAVRAALEDGVRAYRFLRGNEPHKLQIATHVPTVQTVAVARTSVAKLTLRTAALVQTRPRLRALARRTAGG